VNFITSGYRTISFPPIFHYSKKDHIAVPIVFPNTNNIFRFYDDDSMTIVFLAAATHIVSVIGLIICEGIMSYRASLSTRMDGCCGNRVVIARIDDKIIDNIIRKIVNSAEVCVTSKVTESIEFSDWILRFCEEHKVTLG
jgi:hypothetical protein